MAEGWTVETLKEHLEREIMDLRVCMNNGFEAQSTATGKALASAQTAVDKAERLADIRSEVQDRMANERNHLQDRMLTRDEYGVAHATLVEKFDLLAGRMDRHEARGVGTSTTVLWAFAGLGAIVGLGGFIFGLIELLTH